MNKARSTVDSLLARDGRHDTTVHEIIKPAIEHEEVVRTERDEVQTAIDREVHQDHYHTSVQPVQQREVLPEQHIDRVEAIEERTYQHGNPEHVKQRLEAESAQFKNTRNVSDVRRTSVTNPTITGEHVHHHVHEIIQPVVQKETIQPSVVHHTIPIHEIHQNEPKHHTASQLPAVTMDEFKRQGGYLGGREEHTDSFEGEPKSVGGTLGGGRATRTTTLTASDLGTDGTRTTETTTSDRGATDSSTAARTAAGVAPSNGATAGGAGNGTMAGAGTAADSSTGISGTGAGTSSYAEKTRSHGSTSSGAKRFGLIDKLNPMKNSNEGRSRISGTVH